MARRKKEADIAGAVGALGGLVFIAYHFIPESRVFIVSGLGIILLAFVGWIVYRVRRTGGNQPPQGGGALPQQSGQMAGATGPGSGGTTSRPVPADPLARQLRAIDWFQFEKLTEAVFARLGSKVTRLGGAHPDGGIDLILERDGFRSAVQCKHWQNIEVGVRQVREFLGALTDQRMAHGKLVTLQGFTADARALALKHGIEIIDEEVFLRMLRGIEADTDPAIQALLNDQRKFCPKCEQEMVLRTAGRGPNAGSRFWGCSAYPKCRFTLPESGQPG